MKEEGRKRRIWKNKLWNHRREKNHTGVEIDEALPIFFVDGDTVAAFDQIVIESRTENVLTVETLNEPQLQYTRWKDR